MADNSDRPVDEYGEPIPTQAELERERQRIEELRRASEEAAALERQLSTQLPTAPVGLPQDVGPAPMATEVAQVPSAPPLSLPVSKGRMYMGPAMTPEEELAFRSAPSLQSRVLVPPPTPEASAGAASRVAAMTAPEPISAYGGAPSPTSIYPEMRQFYAQQQIRKAVESGVPMEQAMQLYGPEFFARGTRPMSEAQRLLYQQRERLANQPKIVHAGNQIWSVEGGKATALTPTPMAKETAQQAAERRIIEKTIDKLTGELVATTAAKRKEELRQQIEDEKRKLSELFRATSSTPIYVGPESSAAAEEPPDLRVGSISFGSTTPKYSVRRIR